MVVPVFNEAANIERVLADAFRATAGLGVDHEIHVVDDGSVDGTADLVLRLMHIHPRLYLHRHGRNRGYGAAIRTGLAAARGAYVLVVDGDGQFRVSEALGRLWRLRGEADVVAGFRLHRSDPWPRRLAGWVYGRILTPLLLGTCYRDVNCGFKLVSRAALEAIELESTGALISAEMLTRARLAGARILEIGVPHHSREHGRATGLLPHVIVCALRELLVLRGDILNRSARARLRAGCDAVESASA